MAHGNYVYNDRGRSHSSSFFYEASWISLAVLFYISTGSRNDERTREWDGGNAIKSHRAQGHIPFCFEDPPLLDLKHHSQQSVLIRIPSFLAGHSVCVYSRLLLGYTWGVHQLSCSFITCKQCFAIRVKITTEVRSRVTKNNRVFSGHQPKISVLLCLMKFHSWN